jgi:putative phage-type endonuclease
MITDQQRAFRKQYLGSSDAAAVLGLDPYRSAADIWLDKTGLDEGFAGNEATDRGNLLEPAVLAWFAQETGKELLRPSTFVSDPLCWNPDAMLSGTEGVEAKTTTSTEDWGEPGSDEVPDRVVVQCHHAFAVLPVLQVMWVPVLMPVFGRFEFRTYRVERNDELARTVEQRGVEFMQKFVRTRERPSDFKPSLEVLKRIRRQPNKTIELPDPLVDAFIVARAAKLQAEADAEATQRALLTALGDAECGTYSKGQLTYFETHRKGHVCEPCTFRQLRVKPARGQS